MFGPERQLGNMLKLLFTALFVATTSGNRVQRCETTYQKSIKVKSLELRPSNFDAGDQVSLHIKLDNHNNTISSGFVHYTIVHGEDEYEPQVDDLCSSTGSIKCPIDKGINDLELKFKMPMYLEPITLFVELLDYNGQSFVCGRIRVKISIWDWLTSWVTPRPSQPIMDVRRSLRGYDMNVTESDSIQNSRIGPTAGMRPSSSSSSILINGTYN